MKNTNCKPIVNQPESDCKPDNDWKAEFEDKYHGKELFQKWEVIDLISSLFQKQKEELIQKTIDVTLNIIILEISQAHKDGEKTSRLTAAYNKTLQALNNL